MLRLYNEWFPILFIIDSVVDLLYLFIIIFVIINYPTKISKLYWYSILGFNYKV
jgi:hypothetical protein